MKNISKQATYKIKISYQTGDSFGSHSTEDYVEAEWNDISIAAQNLQRIKEHYEYYKWLDSYGQRYHKGDNMERPESWAGTKWDGKPIKKEDDNQIDCNIILLLDNGSEWSFRPFWCGYFESLHSASIEIDLPKVEF